MSTHSREPCGCKSDGTKWLELCPTHRTEFDETHARWAAEKIAREKPRPDEGAATRYL